MSPTQRLLTLTPRSARPARRLTMAPGRGCTMRKGQIKLFRMADLLDERTEDFALREAMDVGMPYAD